MPQWVYNSFMIARSFHNLSLSAACGEKQVQTAIDAFFSPEFLCKSWSTFSTRNSLLLFESLYFGDQDWRKVFRPVAGHFGDRKGQWILKEDMVRFLQLYSHRNKYCRLSEYVRLKIYLGNTSECIYFAVVFTGRYLISISIHGFTPIVKYGLVSQEIEILPMFL